MLGMVLVERRCSTMIRVQTTTPLPNPVVFGKPYVYPMTQMARV